MARLPEHEPRQDNVGISFRDKKAVFFQIVHFPLNLFDLFFQELFSFGCGGFRVELSLELFQFFFSFRNELVRFVSLLWPTVAGKRLKVCRRAVHIRSAIGVGAVPIYIHVALDEERFPVCFRILEFENCVAVEKIMAGNDLVEAN